MRTIYAYAHVHWDREWYRTFESYRLQLLSVVNSILNELESGSLTKFYLDGQSILLDDMLHLQPGLAPRLESLMRAGKLYAGPWYVLADQMLVGGESLIRNLSFGIASVTRFGAPAMIGYCPDTFGHTHDLPRILNGFGIKTAVVWRGVPLLELGPTFWWRSPDGSSVLAYHLTRGYYHTPFHELPSAVSGMEKLEKFLEDFVDGDPQGSRSALGSESNGALLPVGGDHTEPPMNFAKTIKDLNKRFQKASKPLQVVPASLTEFLANVLQSSTKADAVAQTVDSELRSNRCAPVYERAYLLYGVLSSRLYLKRANRLAEHALVRMCEPISALAAAYGYMDYPTAELNHCWQSVMRNHPHDSICGCSVDEVHRQNVNRFEEVQEFMQNLLRRAAIAIAGQPQGHALSALDPAFGSDKLAVLNTAGSAVQAPVPFKWRRELDDKTPLPAWVQVDKRTKIDDLFSFFVGVPYYKQVEELEGWVWPGAVPGLGIKVLDHPNNLPAPVATTAAADENEAPAVTVRSRKLSNGLLEMSVGGDGKLVVSQTVPGEAARVYRIHHALRDVGDCGDSYNFDPVPHDKPVQAKVVDVAAGRTGPIVGSLVMTYELDLPINAVEDHSVVKLLGTNPGKIQLLKRSPKRVKQKVKVEISLRKGVPILFFDASFDNLASDHRLELVFETESEVKTSYSENHFSLIQRHHGGRPDKLPVPLRYEATPDRFPCQRFFIANGQVFFNTGMPEYGVDGSAVTMTLLRAFSWLSKPQLWTRGGGAGPNLPVPEGNCLGPNACSYGWAPLGAGKHTYSMIDSQNVARAYHLAEIYEGSLWASGSKRDDLPEGSMIALDNELVRVMSMHMDDGGVVVRFLNVTGETQRLSLTLRRNKFASASEITLSGATVREIPIKSSGCSLELERHQLVTLRLAFRKRR
jgi:hypothetical protein